MRIADILSIPLESENLTPTNQINDSLDTELTKCRFHQFANLINQRVQAKKIFKFKYIHSHEVVVQLHKLNQDKSCPIGSIPTRPLKENFDVFGVQLQNSINNSLINRVFPKKLRMGKHRPCSKMKIPSLIRLQLC